MVTNDLLRSVDILAGFLGFPVFFDLNPNMLLRGLITLDPCFNVYVFFDLMM